MVDSVAGQLLGRAGVCSVRRGQQLVVNVTNVKNRVRPNEPAKVQRSQRGRYNVAGNAVVVVRGAAVGMRV